MTGAAALADAEFIGNGWRARLRMQEVRDQLTDGSKRPAIGCLVGNFSFVGLPTNLVAQVRSIERCT